MVLFQVFETELFNKNFYALIYLKYFYLKC